MLALHVSLHKRPFYKTPRTHGIKEWRSATAEFPRGSTYLSAVYWHWLWLTIGLKLKFESQDTRLLTTDAPESGGVQVDTQSQDENDRSEPFCECDFLYGWNNDDEMLCIECGKRVLP